MKKNRETVPQRDDRMTHGQVIEVSTILLQAIPYMTITQAQGIVGMKGIVIKKVKKVIQELARFTELGNLVHFETFFLEVNYNLNYKKMVAAGKFKYIDDNVNPENFPFPEDIVQTHVVMSTGGIVQFNAVILRFKGVITDEEALDRLDKAGLRAGILPELLAFVARYPNVLEKHSITAPGSMFKEGGGHTVPTVYQHGSPPRHFGRVSCLQGDFNGTFLAIPKHT